MFTDRQIWAFHSKYVITDSGCWEWQGAKTTGEYGYHSCTHYRNGKKVVYLGAHRFSYILHNNYYPESKEVVTHSCDNPRCVNPDHLVLGTTQTNTQEAVDRGLLVNVKGEQHGRAVLKEKQVVSIKKLIEKGMTDYAISKLFPVSPSSIRSIRIGKNWKHVKV